MEKKINELKVEFNIPDFLQSDINNFIEAINAGSRDWDCWWQEVYGSINMCMHGGSLTEEQADILRTYYCKGGYVDGKR